MLLRVALTQPGNFMDQKLAECMIHVAGLVIDREDGNNTMELAAYDFSGELIASAANGSWAECERVFQAQIENMKATDVHHMNAWLYRGIRDNNAKFVTRKVF